MQPRLGLCADPLVSTRVLTLQSDSRPACRWDLQRLVGFVSEAGCGQPKGEERAAERAIRADSSRLAALCKKGLLGGLLLLLVCLSGLAEAATFTIANGDVATLNSAIFASNMNQQDDTIVLANGGSYILTTPDSSDAGFQVIGADNGHRLTIQGNGSTIARSTASGIPAFRLFYLGLGAKVSFSGVTLAHGLESTGSAIYAPRAEVVMSDCTVRDNTGSALSLSGASNGNASPTMTTCTLSGNAAPDTGGAISSAGSGGTSTVTLDRCLLLNNSSSLGGAILVGGDAGTSIVKLTNCTFSGNSVSGLFALGGAIVNRASGQHKRLHPARGDRYGQPAGRTAEHRVCRWPGSRAGTGDGAADPEDRSQCARAWSR